LASLPGRDEGGLTLVYIVDKSLFDGRFFNRNIKMNRIFKIELIVGTALIVALLAVVFITGCRKKQAEPPKASAPSGTKSHKLDTQIKTPVVEANGPNVVASPTEPAVNKTRTTAGKTPPKAADTKPAMQRKTPSSAQLKAPPMPRPADLKPLESLKDNDEKIEYITDYADEHPESAAIMVYNVLDDNDVEVRAAAMEMLAMKELDDPNVVFVADKALRDSEPQVRQSAVEACAPVTDPAVGKVLIDALADESEDVRTAAIELADQKEPAIRLEVLKAGITSQYEDVREGAISSLTDASSPAAVDILIEGLQNPNPEFREPFKDALDSLLSTDGDLTTYDQYKKWWNANRSRFDNELVEKD
jgi:hypothetical protein